MGGVTPPLHRLPGLSIGIKQWDGIGIEWGGWLIIFFANALHTTGYNDFHLNSTGSSCVIGRLPFP